MRLLTWWAISARPYVPVAATGSLNVAAGRLSYAFDLRGLAMAVDTACSSSLVATHAGLTFLASAGAGGGGGSGPRRAFHALALGVNLTLAAAVAASCAAAGMLSAVGRCKTLAAAADGYVRGEACAALKLSSGELGGGGGGGGGPEGAAATTMIVVRGAAVNQDGKSSSLTTPNGPAQQRVIREAVERAAADPASVTSLSLHGTGTALGDPIEVGAAVGALRADREDEDEEGAPQAQPLLLSALKSHSGHTESASGTLGLVRMIDGLRSADHPAAPILHLRTMNQFVVSAARSAAEGGERGLFALRQAAPAARGAAPPSMTGISAFGFSARAYTRPLFCST